jgi:hypothetical protein
MISLNELLTKDSGEMLNDSLLSEAVVRYYSLLYAGGQNVRRCQTSRSNYFRRLQIDGLQTQTKLTMAKYHLAPGSVIQYCGQMYNSSTITDEIAEDFISKFPKMKAQFIKVPEVKTETSEAEVPEVKANEVPEVKTRKPRSKNK